MAYFGSKFTKLHLSELALKPWITNEDTFERRHLSLVFPRPQLRKIFKIYQQKLNNQTNNLHISHRIEMNQCLQFQIWSIIGKTKKTTNHHAMYHHIQIGGSDFYHQGSQDSNKKTLSRSTMDYEIIECQIMEGRLLIR